ncbi:MAG TPA: TonB-dependent receptor, partial [Phenylobacterium sp.]|nr:TonB-dependent receptor [Phenylobacterium sp.]
DLKGSRLFQSPEHKVAINGNYTWDFDAGSLVASATGFWTDETIYQPFENPAFAVPSYATADFRLIWRDIEDRYSLIGYVKNAFDEEGFTSTSSTNPTAVFGNPNPGLVVGGQSYLRQTGASISRGLIQPRTFGLELQYRF